MMDNVVPLCPYYYALGSLRMKGKDAICIVKFNTYVINISCTDRGHEYEECELYLMSNFRNIL